MKEKPESIFETRFGFKHTCRESIDRTLPNMRNTDSNTYEADWSDRDIRCDIMKYHIIVIPT